MNQKKLLILLLEVVLLAGCHGGQKSNTTELSNQNTTKLVPNPRILHLKTLNQLASTADFKENFSKNLAINNGVRIGYGYDPASGNIIVINDFDDKDMYYIDSAGKQISGFAGMSQTNRTLKCYAGAYGSEIGGTSMYSTANLIDVNLNGSTGVGLGKVSAALSASYADSYADQGHHYDMVYGAKRVCDLNSLAAPEINPTDINYQQAAAAIRMASTDINNSITAIERQTDPSIRKQLIDAFYRNHGTYMVSSVRLGAIAVKNIHLSEAQNNGSSNIDVSTQVSYSSPFNEASGSGKFSRSTTFEGQSWNYDLTEGQYPAGEIANELKETISDIQNELDRMKSDGIININGLNPPDTASVDKDHSLSTPSIPDYADKGAFPDYKSAKISFKALEDALDSVDEDTSSDNDVATEKLYQNNSENIHDAISQATILQSPGESGKPLEQFLQKTERDDFNQKLLPVVDFWRKQKQGSLYSTAAEDLEKGEDITDIKKKIQANIEAKNNMRFNDWTKITEDEVKASEAIRSKLNGKLTYKQFILSQMGNGADANKISDDEFDEWLSNMEETNPQKVMDWNSTWTKETQAKQTTLRSVPLLVSQKEADEFKSTLSSKYDDDDVSDDSIYAKDTGILDFSITPWVKIFPVLSQNIFVNDYKDVGASLAINAISKSINILNYLEYVQHLDPSLSGLYSSMRKSQATLQNLQKSILDLKADSSSNQIVRFDGSDYDLDNLDSIYTLRNAVTKFVDNQFKTTGGNNAPEWYKITKLLFDKEIISNYGAFAGLQIIPKDCANCNKENTDQGYSLIQEYTIDPTTQEIRFESFTTGETTGVLVGGGNHGNHLGTDYKTSAYNKIGQLALKYISKDGKPHRLLGVMPLVLSQTKLSNNIVTGLGLADSKGRIWAENTSVSQSGEQYNGKTATYSLLMDEQSQVNQASPAYILIINNGTIYSNPVQLACDNPLSKNLIQDYRLGTSRTTTYCRQAAQLVIKPITSSDLDDMSGQIKNGTQMPLLPDYGF